MINKMIKYNKFFFFIQKRMFYIGHPATLHLYIHNPQSSISSAVRLKQGLDQANKREQTRMNELVSMYKQCREY